MRNIVFVGPLGGGKTPNNGASIKNYYIRNVLSKHAPKTIFVDTENWKRNPFVVLKLLLVILFLGRSKFVISANSLSAYRLLKLLKIFRKRKNIYYWVIGGSVANWIKEQRVSRDVYRIVELFIVEGVSMEKTLNECGFFNVLTVPNFKAITYIPVKTNMSDKCKFIFLSRITESKGCDIIIEAVRRLNAAGKRDEFTVDFYGPIDINYKEHFLQGITDVDNIQYKGFIDLRESKNYNVLALYDVMLFPTYWQGEGFPGIIIDSYIAGLPIIATDWSLNKDLVENGVTGWIIPAHDANALEEAMSNVIHSNDIKQMSQICQSMALNYDTNHVLQRKLFEEIGLIEAEHA